MPFGAERRSGGAAMSRLKSHGNDLPAGAPTPVNVIERDAPRVTRLRLMGGPHQPRAPNGIPPSGGPSGRPGLRVDQAHGVIVSRDVRLALLGGHVRLEGR